MHRWKFLFAVLLTGVLALGAYLFVPSPSSQSNRPFALADSYLRATYARDFDEVYDLLSSSDRRERTRQNFVKNQGSYSGFALEVSRKLAGVMKIWLIENEDHRNRRLIKIGFHVPAPAELNDLLLDWDQDRLNALSQEKQKQILAELDKREQSGKLLKVEGQETIELIEEAQGWRIFLDWAAGAHVLLESRIPGSENVAVKFKATELMIKTDEPFLVNLIVKNANPYPVNFTVTHLVEPPAIADNLQLVECGLRTPTTLDARQEQEFAMAYQINAATGQTLREFKLTYDFKLKQAY